MIETIEQRDLQAARKSTFPMKLITPRDLNGALTSSTLRRFGAVLPRTALLTLVILPLLHPQALPATSGLTGVDCVWPTEAPPTRVTGFRFSFHITEATTFAILFSFRYLSSSDGMAASSYVIEPNIYEGGLYYPDGTLTSWPMAGTNVWGEGSLRLAVDHPGNGAEIGTFPQQPTMFPRMTYNPDGLLQTWKTDMISQTNLVGKDCSVAFTKGLLLTNPIGWHFPDELPAGKYQEWRADVKIGTNAYTASFAFPDGTANYLYTAIPFSFDTEWYHSSRNTTVCLWDLEFKEEAKPDWERLYSWRITHHDGDLNDFGIKLGTYQDHKVLQVSSRDGENYSATGSIVYIGEFPRITSIVVSNSTCKLGIDVPRSRFDSTGGFIVERLADFHSSATCVASSPTPTNVISFPTSDATQSFYRCRYGMHSVDLSAMDTNLASVIKSFITNKQTPTNAIYDVDLNRITFLGGNGSGIHSISGIDVLRSLRVLVLHDNYVTDLTPIRGMPQLTGLHMWNNGLSDAFPISSLTNLTDLHLGWNQVIDLSFLRGLTELRFLALWNNGITDISSLRWLKNLTALYLSNNSITDVQPLLENAASGGIGASTEVWLDGNPIAEPQAVDRLRTVYGVKVHYP